MPDEHITIDLEPQLCYSVTVHLLHCVISGDATVMEPYKPAVFAFSSHILTLLGTLGGSQPGPKPELSRSESVFWKS